MHGLLNTTLCETVQRLHGAQWCIDLVEAVQYRMSCIHPSSVVGALVTPVLEIYTWHSGILVITVTYSKLRRVTWIFAANF